MARVLDVPEDVLAKCPDYDLLKKILASFHKQGDERNWDAYRNKLTNQELMAQWSTIMSECYRSGYINPQVRNGKITWQQIITSGKYHSLDACTLCERLCEWREEIDSGRAKWMRQHKTGYREPQRCRE